MSRDYQKLLLRAFIIIFITFLTFLPSFNLALFGDDWLAFYRYLHHLGPNASEDWNYISYFLTPYGAQDIMMGLLQNIFGYYGKYYHFVSFSLRLVAAFSLYPLVFYLTKSKLATFFAILFFSVTTTGIETTNWVFNMPTYITVTLFNLSLYFFIKGREDNKKSSLFIFALLYYLAYITTPIRMHGSIILLFLLEVFWIIQKNNIPTIKKASLRFLTVLLVFLFIRFTGQSLGPANEPIERFTLGVQTSLQLLSLGKIDFLFYPLITFGSMIIPDFILPTGMKNLLLLIIGSCILTTAIYLCIKHFKNTNVSTALFFSIIWSFLSFFFAWWWMPETIIPGHHRYLIVSASAISILFATFISLGKGFKNQLSLFLILSGFLLIHLYSTNYYLRLMENFHSQQITDKIWSSVPYIPEVGKEPLVFYFEGETSNYVVLHNVITFGFPPHMQLLYNLTGKNPAPVPMTNWQEVVSAVKDGQSFKPYGYPLEPIKITQVYAFYLQGKDKLINITDLARQKLVEQTQK